LHQGCPRTRPALCAGSTASPAAQSSVKWLAEHASVLRRWTRDTKSTKERKVPPSPAPCLDTRPECCQQRSFGGAAQHASQVYLSSSAGVFLVPWVSTLPIPFARHRCAIYIPSRAMSTPARRATVTCVRTNASWLPVNQARRYRQHTPHPLPPTYPPPRAHGLPNMERTQRTHATHATQRRRHQ
jgi:hypothetical protein